MKRADRSRDDDENAGARAAAAQPPVPAAPAQREAFDAWYDAHSGAQLPQLSVCSFLGYEYEPKSTSFDMRPFLAAGVVVAEGGRWRFEDHVRGQIRGVTLELSNARSERIAKKGDDGDEAKEEDVQFLLSFAFPKPFRGETCLVPDVTAIGNRLIRRCRTFFRPRLPNERTACWKR